LLHPAHLPSLISFPTRRSSDLIVSFISWRTRFFSRSSSILYNLSASALPNRFNEPSFLYAEDSLDMSPLSKASLTANIRDLTESFTLLLDRIREKASSKVSPAPASILLLAALATFASEAESSFNFILMFNSAHLLLLPNSVLLFSILCQLQGREYND